MARLLRQALLFLLVTAVLYAGTMFALYRIRPGGNAILFRCGDYYKGKGGVTWTKFREFDPHARYDAIVIGSSHAYRGYDPAIFATRGVRMFNLGTSAQSPMNSYFVLRHYVDPARCGLVIFDLYENLLGNEGLESTSELSRNIDDDGVALRMCLASKDPRAIDLMTLRWLSANEAPSELDSTYHPGGFAGRTDSVRTTIAFPQGTPLKLDSTQIRYLRKCITYCRVEGLKLVFVTHYYPRASDHARHAAFHALMQRELAGTGIPYIDLAYAGKVDDRHHFFDHNHLNVAGVRLFNAELLDSLQVRGMLPAER